MKVFYITLVFVLLNLNSFGQAGQTILWENTIAGSDFDDCAMLISTPDGGSIVVGSSISNIGIDKSNNLLVDSITGYYSAYNSFNGNYSRPPLDYWIVKLDTNGLVVWDKTYGGNLEDHATNVINTSDGGYLVSGYSNSFSSFDKTGSNLLDTSLNYYLNLPMDYWLLKLDVNGNLEWDKTIGGFEDDGEGNVIVKEKNNGGYIVGGSSKSEIGADKTDASKGYYDYWIVSLDGVGNILWDKAIGGEYNDRLADLEKCIGGGYLLTGTSNSNIGFDKSENHRSNNSYNSPGSILTNDYWIVRIDENGLVLWDKTIGGATRDVAKKGKQTSDGGYLIGGSSYSPVSFDKTAIQLGQDDYWIVKLNSSGNILWDKSYGGDRLDELNDLRVEEYGGFILGGRSSSNASFYKSENATNTYRHDYWIIKLNDIGIKEWDNTLGGLNNDYLYSIDTDMQGNYLLAGASVSDSLIDKSENANDLDYWALKIACLPFSDTIINNLFPSDQVICAYGTPSVIEGTNDNYIFEDFITYQWEISTDNITWLELNNVTSQHYLPQPTSNTTYYRRIASWSCLYHDTSNVHAVIINLDIAAEVEMGGNIYTCPNYPVSLGHNLSITGGNPPFTYSWDNSSMLNNNTIANPEATTSSNTLYTLTLEDDLGCIIVDQVYVVMYETNAGTDKHYCNSQNPALLGSVPLAGIPATYSWSPTNGLNNPNIAQPSASPSSTEEYVLTVSYYNQDSSVCTLSDNAEVKVIADFNAFAGNDTTICYKTPLFLGAPDVPEFSYNWTPPLAFDAPNNAQTLLNQNFSMLNNTPNLFEVTAVSENCIFTDELEVIVLGSNQIFTAGGSHCGPGRIGKQDLTPNINEVYQWTKLASSTGTGNFIGVTDSSYAFVSSPGTGTDYYQVDISYNNVTCSDIISVSSCPVGVAPSVDINLYYPACTAYDPNDTVNISTIGPNNGTYTWSITPISISSSGKLITARLGDIDTVIVSYVDNFDSTLVLVDTIIIDSNDYYIDYPVFDISDTVVCSGEQIILGDTGQPHYDYLWRKDFSSFVAYNGLSEIPITVNSLTEGVYVVRVQDVLSGCFSWDTALVISKEVSADAGFDSILICSPSEIELGTPDVSNGQYSYLWSPALVPWQNATNENFAQPEVLVATGVQFTLIVTDTTYNCVAIDSVKVIVDPLPKIQKANDIILCPGDGGLIGSAPLYGATYSWTPTSFLDDASIAQPFASPFNSQQYIVEINLLGNCTSSVFDTIEVEIFDPSFDLGNDLVFCPTQGAVSLGQNAPTVGVTSYSWMPNVGLSDDVIANPSSNFAGNLTYELTVVYQNGCTFSDEISISPLSEAVVEQDLLVCEGEVVSVGSASNQGVLSWFGTGSAFISNNTAPNPTFDSNLSGPGNFNLFLTSTQQGCSSTDFLIIDVFEKPSLNNNFTVCQGSCIQIGTILSDPYQFQWVPGTNLSDPNIAEPVACLDSSMTYTVSYTNYANNCSFQEQVYVDVNNTPPPSIDFVQDTFSYCNDTSFVLNPTISTPTTTYSYVWSPSLGLSQNQTPNTVASVSQSNINYTLTVTDNESNCLNQSSVYFNYDCSDPEICGNGVDDDGDGLIDFDDPDCYCTVDSTLNFTICQGDFILLSNSDTALVNGVYLDTISIPNSCDSIVITNLFVISNELSTVSDTICENESYTLPGGMVASVTGTYIDTLISASLCDSIITTNLLVGTHVQTAIADTICSNETYTLPDGTIVNSTGTYVQNFTSSLNCDSIVEINLVVNDIFAFNPFPDTTICEDEVQQIDVHGFLQGEDYLWSNGIGGQFLVTNESGVYVVTFTQSNGCIVTDTISVATEYCLEGCYIVIPDGFSPNKDGVNEVFKPITDCDNLESYLFNIYNRWGELIFSTTDFQEGWDGTYKGKKQGIDVFVFSIQYQQADGSGEQTISGTVTLIR